MSAAPETENPAPAPSTTDAPATAAVTEAATTTESAAPFEYGYLDDLDLPPFRIHATRGRGGGAQRLSGSGSNLQIPPGIQQQQQQLQMLQQQQQKRYSLDSKVTYMTGSSPTMATSSTTSSITSVGGFRGRSRSRSPSMRERAAAMASGSASGNASFSSLEEIIDSDILYDKMGFVDGVPNDGKDGTKSTYHQHSHSWSENTKPILNLTPVSERMSEDTLEDVHAFSDLSANTNTRPSSSVGGSTAGGEVSSHVLEPLDEIDEDFVEDDIESDEEVDMAADTDEATAQVIVTNMENITLQQQDS